MLLALILGIILGGVAILIAMQNTAPVMVSILDIHVAAPLALVMFTALLLGVASTLLAMLPTAINNALDEYAARREARRQQAAELQTAQQSVTS